MMIYRDIEYTVVQGIKRGVWKWSASVAGVVVTYLVIHIFLFDL